MMRRRLTARDRWNRDQRESEFQSSVLEAATALGWKWYHTRDSRHSPEGFPDLVLVKPPRVVFAELKTETGKLSVDQLVWYGLLLQCPSVEVYAWRPRDMDEVIRILQGGSPSLPIPSRS